VNVLVGSDGGIRTVRVPHTVGMGLDQAAITAAVEWQFEPAYRNGQAVDSWTSVQVEFGDHDRKLTVGRVF
jgi:TonB family protein